MGKGGKSKGKGREMDVVGEEGKGKTREVKKGGGEEAEGGRKEMARKEQATSKKTRTEKEDGKGDSRKSKAHPDTLRP